MNKAEQGARNSMDIDSPTGMVEVPDPLFSCHLTLAHSKFNDS